MRTFVSQKNQMVKRVSIRIRPEEAFDEQRVRSIALKKAGYRPDDPCEVRIFRRSLDARGKPVYQLEVDVYAPGQQPDDTTENPLAKLSSESPEVHIVGMGPAGLFAALRLIQLGIKPIIIDRGKDVRSRRRDLALLTRSHVVNEDSNYCFGEGGAGTYSDGKLYTRSLKRGDVRRVLEWFVTFGADPNILVDAHPHIGTNRLPQIIASIREGILESGGEVKFETKLVDFDVVENRIKRITTNNGVDLASRVILATGHGARDVFHLLHAKAISLEAKPFALGVRVEHPQALIDRIQYRCEERGAHLPAASYALVHQVNGKGVYSFCMCPGGIIAPCATSPGEVVTNGWSPSRRNNPFANSGMVVSVELEDLKPFGFEGPLAALEFQRMVEQRCCEAAGGQQHAPAQRLTDFIAGVQSVDLPSCSYKPGLVSVNLRTLLPAFIGDRLAAGFEAFGRKMKGFVTPEAVVVAPESRTSSPVRIPRDPVSLDHPDVKGLYPCGEGAGYAGGIASAAMDGIRVANAVAQSLGVQSSN